VACKVRFRAHSKPLEALLQNTNPTKRIMETFLPTFPIKGGEGEGGRET